MTLPVVTDSKIQHYSLIKVAQTCPFLIESFPSEVFAHYICGCQWIIAIKNKKDFYSELFSSHLPTFFPIRPFLCYFHRLTKECDRRDLY